MPTFAKNLTGGKAISGGALQPRGRRGSSAQVAGYWSGGKRSDIDLLVQVIGSGAGGHGGTYGAGWGAGGSGGGVSQGVIVKGAGTFLVTVGGAGGRNGNGNVSSFDTVSANGGLTGAGSWGDVGRAGGTGNYGNGGAGGSANCGVGGAGPISNFATGSNVQYSGGGTAGCGGQTGGGAGGGGFSGFNGDGGTGWYTGGNGTQYGAGGGGGYGMWAQGTGGFGYQGVVHIKYLTGDKTDAGLTITGGTITTVGAYTVHTFTGTTNLVITA